MADEQDIRLRGGKMMDRDPWFGLSVKPGFKAFRRYWHREKRHIGRDLMTREEALAAYEDWAATHEPEAKG